MDYNFRIVGSNVEDTMGPLVRGLEELGVICFISHILFLSCARILICVSFL